MASTKEKPKEAVFSKLLIESAFKGGPIAWMKFLNKNLHYPKEAIDIEARGTAIISFDIDTTGHISDIKIDKDPGHGLGNEALRVIKLTDGMWEPMIQNSVKVKSNKKMPIVFDLVTENLP